MFILAIAELATDLEAEATALARDLGTTAYDARLSLSSGLPAVVLITAERERAVTLLASLRARGHMAVACDGDAVVSSADMVSLRHFALDDDGVTSDGKRLAWDDVFAMLPATHRRAIVKQTKEKERKFNAGLAIATSGIVMTKTVTKETRSQTEEREQVLYLFRRSGAKPWILFENGTVYTPLAELGRLSPARLENFRELVKILRERARAAVYDERLMGVRRVPERASMAGTSSASSVTTSSDAGMDLLAHILAMTIAKQGRGMSPYRT